MTEMPPRPPGARSMKRSLRQGDSIARALLTFFLDLPRKFQLGIVLVVFGGLARVTGADSMVLNLLRGDFGISAEQRDASAIQPNRAHRPELRLERSDGGALDGR